MPTAQAGTFELVPNTTPTPVEINGKRYVIIKKDGSVSFKVAQPEGLQSIKWKFSNGSPGDKTGIGPHDIKYDKEAGWGAVNPVQIEVKRKVGDQNCNTPFKRVAAVVVPMIEPDAGQAGTNGDMAPSNKGATGEKHYVSPKKAGEFVTFKAKFGSEFAFGDALEWEGGEEVTGGPDKRKVSRGATGKTVLKIKRKNDGVEVARLNVWIVWATPREPVNVATDASNTTNADPHNTGTSHTWRIPVATRKRFIFEIEPATIVTDLNENKDAPNLTGPNSVAPPGGSVLSSGANKKWDVSRRIRIKHRNPAPTTLAKNDYWGAPNHQDGINANANSFPSASVEVVTYPNDSLVGNDDRGTGDEVNNPYTNADSLPNNNNFTPAVGELASTDRVTSPFLRSASGQNDEEAEIKLQFGEFVRLEINGKWYLISDFLSWQVIQKFKRDATSFKDNGSLTQNDNANY